MLAVDEIVFGVLSDTSFIDAYYCAKFLSVKITLVVLNKSRIYFWMIFLLTKKLLFNQILIKQLIIQKY